MKKIRTVLVGLGTVNLGLLNILIEKKDLILQNHNLEVCIVGVADSSGMAIKDEGYSYTEIIQLKSHGEKVSHLAGHLPGVAVEKIANHVDAELLVDGSPVNLKTGQPGLQAIQLALEVGWNVVSANKAPLVLAFNELHARAKKHGGQLAYSAAVCGGLPVINVLRRDLHATNLKGLKGIFNATSNFILNELEKGGSFEEAVKEAQRIGAAEADPSLDIDGYDTSNKLYIIMKSFTNFSGSVNDIKVNGIRQMTSEKLKEASLRGKRIKLLAEAHRNGEGWNLSVQPTEVDSSSFLATCVGWEMGLQLQTDYYEELYLKIYEEDPISTCAAVVRDIINISEAL